MKQFEVAPDLELKTEPILKSAFVIKKGAYEKLVCAKCAEKKRFVPGTIVWPSNVRWPEGQAPTLGVNGSEHFIPVTLSCEAFCSICDEAI
jgi:hypothetical protein